MGMCTCNSADIRRGQNHPITINSGRDLSDVTTVQATLVVASMQIKLWASDEIEILDNIIKLPLHREESVHFPIGSGTVIITYSVANNTIVESIPVKISPSNTLIAGHGIAIHGDVISTIGGGEDDGMEKHLLFLHDTTIYDGETECTFDYLYDLMMNTPSFVVLVANERAYHPNVVSQTEIVFTSTTEVSGIISVSRIRMDTRNRVTIQGAAAEKVANKSNELDSSEDKYPSNKAVLDYVTSYFNDYVLPKKANQYGSMTPSDVYNLGDGLYYFLRPVYNMTSSGKSLHGLCSISQHFINNYDYGIYFGDYSSSSQKFATVGSIDGYGEIERG